MKTLRKLSGILGAIAVVAMMAVTANAGCGDIGGQGDLEAASMARERVRVGSAPIDQQPGQRSDYWYVAGHIHLRTARRSTPGFQSGTQMEPKS